MNTIPDLLQQDDFLRTLFDAIPSGVVVVDPKGWVEAVNDVVKQTFRAEAAPPLNKATGDMLHCLHALHSPRGCGTSEFCQSCRVRKAAEAALSGQRVFREKADMLLAVDGKPREWTLLVSAAPVKYRGANFALVVLEDVTELNRLRKQLHTEQGFAGIMGRHEKMLELFDAIMELAEVNVPVLIQGESGTGKELVAAAIHNQGPRADGPFVAVNCGALPDALLESELFGHVKGAFTGAFRDRQGRFALAHRGTIFLDEVGDLSPAMQVKLLRVLQEGTFERVGDEETIQVDVRVISATNKDLRAEIAAGRFRQDLYYRLCIVPVTLPPLRDRPNDVPLLAEHFIASAAEGQHRPKPALSADALAALVDYDWPGNVRELQNAVQFALVKCKGDTIDPAHLPPTVLRQTPPKRATRRKKLDALSVANALAEAGNNKVNAAKLLGVSRATLYRFLSETHP